MNNCLPQYTTDYISGVMSPRKPQEQSLKILEGIVNSVILRKRMNLKAALDAVHAMYPICSDFERGFIKAEVVNYQDLLNCGTYTAAKEKGLVRMEGKDYVVKDGDVVLFRFNV